MKKTCLIIFSLVLSIMSFAQSANDIGKITLSVVTQEETEELSSSQLSRLETKISQMVTNAGLVAAGYSSSFAISPKFIINETNVVEGGMQNITVVSAELNLSITQVENGLSFSTISKQIKGSGNTQELAITNAISKIPTNDPSIKTFIETGKTKIIQYYQTKCGDIIRKSDDYVKMKRYDAALGLLMSVPEEVTTCHNQIHDKVITAYKAYQTQRCSEQIHQAKMALAANNYSEALNILAYIDPSAGCYNEVQALAKTAAAKVTAEEKKIWDFQMKVYNDAVSLEKQRIQAVKDIAVSYYNSKSKNNNVYIVR